MFQSDQYELIDFGQGRKLERFGEFILDRPAPAAEQAEKRNPNRWDEADGKFLCQQKNEGQWSWKIEPPESWEIVHGQSRFLLKPTSFGHVGIFVEQAENWDWFRRQLSKSESPPRVLNLFAYTGGSTLACAAAGAEVVHVDSAKSAVQWGRKNALLSNLQDAKIRWIVEDVQKFVSREVKRGNQYEAVILDPPTYGHGPKGETWKIQRDLLPLLKDCRELTREGRAFLCLSCHSPGFGSAELQATLADAVFGSCQAGANAKPLVVKRTNGGKLSSGFVARWSRDEIVDLGDSFDFFEEHPNP